MLTSGPIPRDPGEVVKARAADGLRSSSSQQSFDFVLIDTPPLLSVGDAMALSAHVDAMITVARLSMLRRRSPRRACPGARDLPDDQARCRRHGRRGGAGVRLRRGYEYHRTAQARSDWVHLPPASSSPSIEESRCGEPRRSSAGGAARTRLGPDADHEQAERDLESSSALVGGAPAPAAAATGAARSAATCSSPT